VWREDSARHRCSAVELAHVGSSSNLIIDFCHARSAVRERWRSGRAGVRRLRLSSAAWAKPFTDAFDDIEIHFHQLLGLVEHRAGSSRRGIAASFSLPVGQQVDVELGADALDERAGSHRFRAAASGGGIQVRRW